MSVYVDPMMPCTPNPRWRWSWVCRLVADSEAELHAFAERLGLQRAWLQEPGVRNTRVPHYGLTEGKRTRAVAMGAAELTRAEFAEKFLVKSGSGEERGGLFGEVGP